MMLSKARLYLCLGALSCTWGASAQSACEKGLKTEVERRNELLDRSYRGLSDGKAELKKTAASQLFLGTVPKRAIFVVHGFMASPYEVQSLASKITKSGYTVYAPLITGFGSSTEIANMVKLEIWKASMRSSLRLLTRCYDKITVVGFSMGGGLLLDLALSEAPADQKLKKHIELMALLAPYVKPATKFAEALNNATKLFSKSIPLRALYIASGNEDLLVPMGNSLAYNDAMPLLANTEMLKLSKQLLSSPDNGINPIPTTLSYSERDKTVDTRVAKEFIERHFKIIRHEPWPGHATSREGPVPHQLLTIESLENGLIGGILAEMSDLY